MKRLTAFVMVSAALALSAASMLAEGPSGRHTRVVSRPSPAGSAQPASMVPKAASAAASYSVQVNIVTRVVGTALFRTTIDITNNTATDGVVATVQYCFTTLNGVFQNCTAGQSLTLFAYDNFHQDDIVQYLGTLGVLPPGADQASFGTLFVTFDNLPSNNGWEGTVTARTYSACAQCTNPTGTVAIAYPGSLFFESSSGTLVGTIRNTTTVSPTPDAGSLRTNLGVTNTALYDAITPVSVQISFFDTVTGSPVGDILAPPHALQAGEVFQFNNVFTHIPSNVTSCIVFIDVLNPASPTPATVEGYINILDGGTQDGAFFEMKCAVGCAGY